MEARIRVRLTPRSVRDKIVGWQEGYLKVRVSAPPVEGKANAALEKLLAGALGVPKLSIGIVSGTRSREKTVVIDGLSQDEALRRLGSP